MLGPFCSDFDSNKKFKYIKVEKKINAKGLRNKPFQYYNNLTYIFQEDRENRTNFEMPIDIASNTSEIIKFQISWSSHHISDVREREIPHWLEKRTKHSL